MLHIGSQYRSYSYLVLLSTLAWDTALPIQQEKPAIKAIVCDIGGVLLTTSKVRLGQTLGWWNLTKYCVLDVKSPLHITSTVQALLNYMGTYEGVSQATAMNTPLPLSLAEWQSGQRSNAQIKEHLKKCIDTMAHDTSIPKEQQCSQREQELLYSVVDILTDPALQITTKKPLPAVVDLLHEVQHANGKQITFIIASNMERECYDPLLQKFPDVFELFDHGRNAVISGTSRSHSLKPYKKFYEEILKKYHLKPEHCLFIDDKQENIDAARALGFNVFHFQKNPHALRECLVKHGLLPQQSFFGRLRQSLSL